MMATFIDHSKYEKKKQVTCSCGWVGSGEKCTSTLHAAFVDLACPTCKEVLVVVDTLGTECGTFVPSINYRTARITPTKRRTWRPVLGFF